MCFGLAYARTAHTLPTYICSARKMNERGNEAERKPQNEHKNRRKTTAEGDFNVFLMKWKRFWCGNTETQLVVQNEKTISLFFFLVGCWSLGRSTWPQILHTAHSAHISLHATVHRPHTKTIKYVYVSVCLLYGCVCTLRDHSIMSQFPCNVAGAPCSCYDEVHMCVWVSREWVWVLAIWN